MTISTNAELKSQLNTYMFHQRFVAQYDNAILKFERVCNRKLRTRQMEASTTLTTTDGATSIPSDYLKWRAVQWSGKTPYIDLDYVHPRYFQSTFAGIDPGNPRIFTIEGSTIKVAPEDDTAGAIVFKYYQKLPTITGSDTGSNWLLTEYPDAYENGALVHLYALARNRELAELYKAWRDELLAEVIQLSALTASPSSVLVRQSGEWF
jgi:hypothetical protein